MNDGKPAPTDVVQTKAVARAAETFAKILAHDHASKHQEQGGAHAKPEVQPRAQEKPVSTTVAHLLKVTALEQKAKKVPKEKVTQKTGHEQLSLLDEDRE